MNNSNWIIRNAIASDLSFIYSTWLKSYRYDSALGHGCRNSIFFPEYSSVIDWILSQPNTQVAVAANPENPEIIFGFMVHQPSVLHYAFTKEAFWRFGIARSLLEHLGGAKFYTHRTQMIQPILSRYQDLIYNPFLLFKQEKLNGETE